MATNLQTKPLTMHFHQPLNSPQRIGSELTHTINAQFIGNSKQKRYKIMQRNKKQQSTTNRKRIGQHMDPGAHRIGNM